MFPFRDGFGVYHRCVKTFSFERRGLEGSNYEVFIINKYPPIYKKFQYYCPTDVDKYGYRKFHSWGWCGDGCPLRSDRSTWGLDDTLTVTPYNQFDSDIYIAIAIVIGAFLSIPLIAKSLRRYGTYFIECDI